MLIISLAGPAPSRCRPLSSNVRPRENTMQKLRSGIAFFAGVWLYYTAVVLTGGVLAAIASPRGYFAFFGKQNLELSLAILFALGWALPVAVLVMGGVLAIRRLVGSTDRQALVWALAGMVSGFALWALGSIVATLGAESYQGSLWQALAGPFTFTWWSALNFFAPWLGFAGAALLLTHSRSRLLRGKA